jgi:hypothetical protein
MRSDQRLDVEFHLGDNPSLKAVLHEAQAYRRALKEAGATVAEELCRALGTVAANLRES